MTNHRKIKRILKDPGRFTPTFYRMDHAPEEGLGGSHWLVRFAGRDIGEVLSMWDFEHGVHWRIADDPGRILTDPAGRPLAFETRADATNHLIRVSGYRGEWDPPEDLEPAY